MTMPWSFAKGGASEAIARELRVYVMDVGRGGVVHKKLVTFAVAGTKLLCRFVEPVKPAG